MVVDALSNAPNRDGKNVAGRPVINVAKAKLEWRRTVDLRSKQNAKKICIDRRGQTDERSIKFPSITRPPMRRICNDQWTSTVSNCMPPNAIDAIDKTADNYGKLAGELEDSSIKVVPPIPKKTILYVSKKKTWHIEVDRNPRTHGCHFEIHIRPWATDAERCQAISEIVQTRCSLAEQSSKYPGNIIRYLDTNLDWVDRVQEDTALAEYINFKIEDMVGYGRWQSTYCLPNTENALRGEIKAVNGSRLPLLMNDTFSYVLQYGEKIGIKEENLSENLKKFIYLIDYYLITSVRSNDPDAGTIHANYPVVLRKDFSRRYESLNEDEKITLRKFLERDENNKNINLYMRINDIKPFAKIFPQGYFNPNNEWMPPIFVIDALASIIHSRRSLWGPPPGYSEGYGMGGFDGEEDLAERRGRKGRPKEIPFGPPLFDALYDDHAIAQASCSSLEHVEKRTFDQRNKTEEQCDILLKINHVKHCVKNVKNKIKVKDLLKNIKVGELISEILVYKNNYSREATEKYLFSDTNIFEDLLALLFVSKNEFSLALDAKYKCREMEDLLEETDKRKEAYGDTTITEYLQEITKVRQTFYQTFRKLSGNSSETTEQEATLRVSQLLDVVARLERYIIED